MEVLAVGMIAGAALLALWAGATRRQVRRRRLAAEWDGAEQRPDLWTSAARCPDCGASGGLLSTSGDALWFSCLACGARHRRETKA